MSKLYKANHVKPLSQLKLLGEFAKIWFGKNFPVAVHYRFFFFQTSRLFYQLCAFGKGLARLLSARLLDMLFRQYCSQMKRAGNRKDNL